MAGKGQPKTGGRTAGTPNKKTEALLEKCERMNIDPFEEMLKLAMFGEAEAIRFHALKEVCQYLYPKRKAIEVSNPIDEKLKQLIEDLETLPPERLVEETERELKLIKATKGK